MGIHLGEVERQGAHYFGAPLYRCARLTATAHGGQTVLSGPAADLVRDALPAGAALRDLGEHRLKDLAAPERIAQLGHPDLPADFPPLRTLDARPHNLPLQVTGFVGRERELGEVTRLLAAERLVTLTGPGGTGKTRIALQVAADVLDAYPGGVWLAELAALADPALVPQAVAAAVGVREEPGRPLLATLTDALRPKRLLLVLDNCEHLVEACARLAEAVLRAGPGVTLLATSREPLGIAGEVTWPVPPLRVPAPETVERLVATGADLATAPAEFEAVRLFAARATAAAPAFRLSAATARTVAEVCRRLDGLPLAIELAAARLRVLPVGQVLARLEDRFRLLTGGHRTALPRQQTLRAAVDWSYDLLTVHERALFNRLSVFAGGWTLEAAEAVCAGEGIAADGVLELLSRLVDRSLVVVDAQPLADGSGRYSWRPCATTRAST
jgi:predicted ATPase